MADITGSQHGPFCACCYDSDGQYRPMINPSRQFGRFDVSSEALNALGIKDLAPQQGAHLVDGVKTWGRPAPHTPDTPENRAAQRAVNERLSLLITSMPADNPVVVDCKGGYVGTAHHQTCHTIRYLSAPMSETELHRMDDDGNVSLMAAEPADRLVATGMDVAWKMLCQDKDAEISRLRAQLGECWTDTEHHEKVREFKVEMARLHNEAIELIVMNGRQAETISTMADENGTLRSERDKLLGELDALRPRASDPKPSNPWGKRHDGRAPDMRPAEDE